MPFIATAVAAITTSLTGFATSLGFSAAASTAIASGVVQFGTSFLINSAITAIFGKSQSAQDVAAELAQQTTAPTYRSVYGECRATGTPAGTPVDGNYIYGAWILNSRPSDLSSFTLYLDKREVELTGDAFDLTGDGAEATEDPFDGHCNVWISRGDHTAPPTAFTTEAPWVDGTADHLWKTTDVWRGLTIIWLKLKAGSSSSRSERWPSAPPLVEVEGKWSLICDPRNPAHDQDDPDTWEWTDNHALCVRDALMTNPVRPYQPDQIHDSFNEYGPDVCDETVALNSGGTEARYTCAGTIAWSDGEIEDQLNPMMISGAADFIRIGGQLGYAAGEYRAPTETITYVLGDSVEFTDMVEGSELVNRMRVSYLSSERGYETAELLPWDIPGALAADGGVPAVRTLDLSFCPSATQAMRVRKISGLRLRREESIQGAMLPPEAFDLVGGATTAIAFPAPYDAYDGIYEVSSIHPGLDPIGESGEVALRLPTSLVKHSAAIYDWTPATDEEGVYNEDYNATRSGVPIPGSLSVESGGSIDLNTGGSVVPRFLFQFAPVATEIDHYEWQWRLDGEEYQTGGTIDPENENGSGDLFFYLPVAAIDEGHDVRVRTVSTAGRSGWVEITGALYDFDLAGVSVAARAGGVTVSGTAPDASAFFGVRIYRADAGDDFSDASAVTEVIEVAAGAAFSVNAGDAALSNDVSNGTFDDSTGWTLGGGWSIAGGVATHTAGTSGFLSQAIAGLVVGDDYRLTFTTASTSGSSVDYDLVGATIEDGTNRTTDGTWQEILTMPASPTGIRFTGNTNLNVDIDGVWLVRDTNDALPIGPAEFWVVPITQTRSEGAPVGPFTITVP